MMSVSGVNTGSARPLAGAGRTLEAPQAQGPGAESRSRPPRPVKDEYVPEEKQEPSSRYWIGRNEEGHPKIYFHGPEQAAEPSGQPETASGAEGPEEGKEAEGAEKKERGEALCAGNTDKVDREIEKLKKEKETPEQQSTFTQLS